MCFNIQGETSFAQHCCFTLLSIVLQCWHYWTTPWLPNSLSHRHCSFADHPPRTLQFSQWSDNAVWIMNQPVEYRVHAPSYNHANFHNKHSFRAAALLQAGAWSGYTMMFLRELLFSWQTRLRNMLYIHINIWGVKKTCLHWRMYGK